MMCTVYPFSEGKTLVSASSMHVSFCGSCVCAFGCVVVCFASCYWFSVAIWQQQWLRRCWMFGLGFGRCSRVPRCMRCTVPDLEAQEDLTMTDHSTLSPPPPSLWCLLWSWLDDPAILISSVWDWLSHLLENFSLLAFVCCFTSGCHWWHLLLLDIFSFWWWVLRVWLLWDVAACVSDELLGCTRIMCMWVIRVCYCVQPLISELPKENCMRCPWLRWWI